MSRRRPRSGRASRAPVRVSGPRTRRRRLAALVLAIGVGGLIAFGITRVGSVEQKIKEVTLPLHHEDIIRQQAADKKIDPALIAAVIYSESRFRDQTSDAGARGLMQVQPQTALQIAAHSGATTFELSDLGNPEINIAYGTFYLRELLNRYGGNEVAALAAYNAGPTAVDGWGGADLTEGDIRAAETRAYVNEVLSKREDYRDNYAGDLGL
jgi:peptidoglycan lytic transglycosylase